MYTHPKLDRIAKIAYPVLLVFVVAVLLMAARSAWTIVARLLEDGDLLVFGGLLTLGFLFGVFVMALLSMSRRDWPE